MNKDIRIVQLIDSLDAGGAERMAVNYANSLADVIPFSGLLTTRKEGALKAQLSEKVPYLFLNKKGKLGWQAVLKLRRFMKRHKVDVIHAHGTSFFTAVLVKFTFPKIRIVWHDHFGNRANSSNVSNTFLKITSAVFEGVLTVNKELEQWAKENLLTKKIHYIPNFIIEHSTEVTEETILKGSISKRIVFLANLKEPKNHLQILKAYMNSNAVSLGWTLHLIGKDFFDFYSEELKWFITSNKLEDFVYIYGSCNDIEPILAQSNIGLLGSTYEGFPVTLLEYGKAKLAVVSTDVGYCKTVIEASKNGLLFNPNDTIEITQKLNAILSIESKRMEYGEALHAKVMCQYSDKAIINEYLEWLR